MNTTNQRQTPFFPTASPIHSFEQSVAPSPQIVISEKEYLALKWEAAYWRRMHKKALLKLEKLLQKKQPEYLPANLY